MTTEFEKAVKAKYPIWGNDISKYQGAVSSNLFMEVQKPKFVIVRMTCGSWMDEKCLTNLKAFHGKTDLHVYSAFLPWSSALSQIKAIVEAWKQVKPYVNGRLWLDIEKQNLYTHLGAALGGTAEYGKLDDVVGHDVGIYTNPNFYNIYQMSIDTRMNWRLIWLANYTESTGQLYPNMPKGLKEAHIWQYASNLGGYGSGCKSASLDGDVFLLDESRYPEILVGSSVWDQEPDPEPEPEEMHIKTIFSAVNLRNAPIIDAATDVATTDKFGVVLPVARMSDDGKWYEVRLFIHKSCVVEV